MTREAAKVTEDGRRKLGMEREEGKRGSLSMNHFLDCAVLGRDVSCGRALMLSMRPGW